MRWPVPLLVALALGSAGWAQKDASRQDAAVTLAAAHPALKPLLAAHEGWNADAYRTETGYGVWRVQFYFPGGEELGWADVNPKQQQVYAWEASYELGGALQRRAERTLYPFVLRHPDVRALLGQEQPLDRWLWYDSWREGWFVHLERGSGSLEVSVRSRRPGPLRLDELFIEKIYFPNVLSLADFRNAQKDRAVALAFADPEVAAALRDAPGWTSTGTPLAGGRWRVVFARNETEIASAVVDLKAARTLEVAVANSP